MTKISDIGEFGFIDAIKEHTLFHPENVAVGIGDDGAVYTTTPGWQQVAVIDTMVQNSHFITPSLSPLCPACTASTMVTELMMRMKVITLTKARGRLACPAPGKALNTTFGSGQKFWLKRMEPYEIRKAPNVKASLIKKYHIISLPYSRLKGLLPPLHHLV